MLTLSIRWRSLALGAAVLLAAGLLAGTVPTHAQSSQGGASGPPLTVGLERLLDRHLDWLTGKRIGLITNPTGTDRELNHAVDLLIAHEDEGGYEVTALYGPEHGVRGGQEAGVYIPSYTDERTGLPVYSLYGPTRKPSAEMLAGVDVLLFDIQDIGARFYTYIWTMYYAIEAAAEHGKEVIVLDRPNPLGDRMDGPVLDPALSSFVGLREIPLQHGLTVGELARLFEGEFLDHVEPQEGFALRVAQMSGYNPRFFDRAWDGRSWVLPSPNIPTQETAWLYPGTGLVESLNLSEGRGTTKPFHWLGAPWIDTNGAYALVDDLNARGLPGVTFRPMFATPSFSKHAGQFSGGIEVHVTDPVAYQPVRTGVHVLDALFRHFDETDWREGEGCRTREHTCWIDRLSGDKDVRAQLDAGADPDEIVAAWQDDLDEFARTAAPYRIYRGGRQP